MSQKNSLAAKKRRRAIKALTPPLPTNLDLIQWLKLRANISTRTANKLILAGCLRSETHTLGIREIQLPDGRTQKIVDPIVPASLRGTIEVVKPKK